MTTGNTQDFYRFLKEDTLIKVNSLLIHVSRGSLVRAPALAGLTLCDVFHLSSLFYLGKLPATNKELACNGKKPRKRVG